MITGSEAVRALESAGVGMFVGVPDSLMKAFCAALESQQGSAIRVPAPNEGSAVAVAAGHYLATGEPAVVYMQNSGLGNAVNPLTSLVHESVYGIPMVLLVGWRGEPGVSDEPQHKRQGEITPALLEACGLRTMIIGPGDEVEMQLKEAVSLARSHGEAVAVLVKKGTFTSTDYTPTARSNMTRLEAMGVVVSEMPDETAFVATTGYTGRELALLRDESGDSWQRDFLMVGSMGHAASIALGMALSQPERPVCCLDGDGAVAMHLGALALIGTESPSNLVHVVFNNGVHESVGGQPTALGELSISEISRSLGYADGFDVADKEGLREAILTTSTASGPTLIEVSVGLADHDNLPRPGDFARRQRDLVEWMSGSA